MSSVARKSNSTWKETYKAAIFEPDAGRSAIRIAEAERVIVDRARALFHQTKGSSDERRALDAALYSLQVLKQYSRTKTFI